MDVLSFLRRFILNKSWKKVCSDHGLLSAAPECERTCVNRVVRLRVWRAPAGVQALLENTGPATGMVSHFYLSHSQAEHPIIATAHASHSCMC